MWWLIGLLAAWAVAAGRSSRSSFAAGPARSPNRPSQTLTYRSRDGSEFFRFRFTPLGNDIRIYIVAYPDPDLGSCHILRDSTGPYICWSTAITTMAAARRIASMWAEATLIYQRTGKAF